MIPKPEATMVRNRNSWRVAYAIDAIEDATDMLVYCGGGADLWPHHYVDRIQSKDLDRALMNLRSTDVDQYNTFITIMLGLHG